MVGRSTRLLVCLAAIVGVSSQAPYLAMAEDYPQIRLNTDGTAQLQNEQQICVDPTAPDTVVACWRDFRLGYRQVGVGFSHDGGTNWVDYLIGGELPWDSDPVLIADDDGTFYLVVINYQDGGANQLAVHRSNTGGVTWEGPFTAVYSGGSTFEDKEWIAVDRTGGPRDGNLYITWSRFNQVQVMCVTSTDRGETWSSPVQVSESGSYGQWSVPLVLANGDLLAAWDRYSDAIRYDISADGGASWGTDRTLTTVSTGPGSQINGGVTIFPYPSLVMDETGGPRAGWVYCVYADRAISSNGVDIWLRRSTDNGQTWSNRIRVNDDPEGLVRDQFHPWVTCDSDGVLTAIWYDRRDDAANYLWHIYLSRSSDGGETWEPSIRVTDVASSPGDALKEDPTGGPRRMPSSPLRAGLIGEYSGVAVGGGVIHPVWTDTRNGNQDTYASVINVFQAGADLALDMSSVSLRGYPNPSRGGVALHYSLEGRHVSGIEILDPTGRRLRSLAVHPVRSGEGLVEWDGTDEVGVELPNGVYFARVIDDGSGLPIRTKIVLAR